MKKDLNIAYHVFGKHDNCGLYCRFNNDKENYDESRYLKSPTLLTHIEELFSKLSENAKKFLLAGSSQANESLNNTMTSFCSKRESYSTSESADYRFACAVAHKNIGD